MDVSALNFCAFALCTTGENGNCGIAASQAIIAAPNALDSGGIDFFNLPSEYRISVLKANSQTKTGMVMALDLFRHPASASLTVVSGYEDGRTMVHTCRSNASANKNWKWELILVGRPHSQPILSLDTTPLKEFYFTSSADAVIAKLAIPNSSSRKASSNQDVQPAKINNTKHAGQQDLTVRNDGKIFATAGWDARIRVYSAKTLKELAVLKWHQDGCYSVAFADILMLDRQEMSHGTDEDEMAMIPKTSPGSALDIIKHQRSVKARMTHWLAAGGKDGKISIWDIY
jgi:ASTRA-associated protein 1